MTRKISITFIFLFFSYCCGLQAQQMTANSFQVIPLGVKGGLDESNLSSYMIAPLGSKNFICADAGTVRHGVDVAISNQVLKGDAAEIIKNNKNLKDQYSIQFFETAQKSNYAFTGRDGKSLNILSSLTLEESEKYKVLKSSWR